MASAIPLRANEAPPASQPTQHLSGSFQLNEARVRRVLRFGYLAPDIVEAIAASSIMDVGRLFQSRQKLELTHHRLLGSVAVAKNR
jgi:hypothetical protein